MKSMYHQPKKKYWVWLLFFLTVLMLIIGGLAWYKLTSGINVERISFSTIRIDDLYIRFDKGLVISANRMIIKPNKKQESFGLFDTENILFVAGKALPMVRKLDIAYLDYNNETLSFLYQDNKLAVKSEKFLAESDVKLKRDIVDLINLKLVIKPFNTTVSGGSVYSFSKNRFDFKGTVQVMGINSNLTLGAQHDLIDVSLSTGKFTNLAQLMELIHLNDEIEEWLSKKIIAGNYQINNLKFQFKKGNSGFEIVPETIEGLASLEDINITFHPDLPAIHSSYSEVIWKGDQLKFMLSKPVYRGKDLSGSSVEIDNVIKGRSYLTLNISTISKLDLGVINLLRAYDVKLPFIQEEGTTQAMLTLKMDLVDYNYQVTGDFKSQKGEWEWSGLPLHLEDLHIQLKNNIIYIDKAGLSFGDLLHANLQGSVDTDMMYAALSADIDKLDIRRNNSKLIYATDIKTPIRFDYSGETLKLDFTKYGVSIFLDEELITISVPKVDTIKEIVPFLNNNNLKSGSVEITTTDWSKFNLEGNAVVINNLIFENDTNVDSFSFTGKADQNETRIDVNEGKMTITLTDTIDVYLGDYTPVFETGIDETNLSDLPGIRIRGNSSRLKIKNIQLPTKSYLLNLDGNKVAYKADFKKGKIEYNLANSSMNFRGLGLDAELAGQIIKTLKLKGGTLDVFLRGTKNNFEGYIEFRDTVIKDYTLLNNLLAFIGTIPALATFSSPGFNSDGYEIKQGFIHFNYKDRVLNINTLRTDGATVNTQSSGLVDLDSSTIQLAMNLHTLKPYGNIINKIPLVGYVLLGEDGTVSTSLDISGKLEDPEITTHIISDIVMIPINILKRTIQWPFQLFKKITD